MTKLQRSCGTFDNCGAPKTHPTPTKHCRQLKVKETVHFKLRKFVLIYIREPHNAIFTRAPSLWLLTRGNQQDVQARAGRDQTAGMALAERFIVHYPKSKGYSLWTRRAPTIMFHNFNRIFYLFCTN